MTAIYLNNVTLIDAAYINKTGVPIGISLNPTFIVEGEVDTPEQVVADFSSIKKSIKELIDHKDTGFDHKLWVFPSPDDKIWVSDTNHGLGNEQKSRLALFTPAVTMYSPANAIRLLSEMPTSEFLHVTVAKQMSEYLTDNLPDGIKVTVVIPRQPEIPGVYNLVQHCLGDTEKVSIVTKQFSYTHGLPMSSSWGCQNIIHGHTSYCTLAGGASERKVEQLADAIQGFLHNAYIYCPVDPSIGCTSSKLSLLAHEYTTERGLFSIEVSKLFKDIYILQMDKAPTIENILEMVICAFRNQLIEAEIKFIAISEGLWKGSHRTCLEADWK